MKWYLVSMCSVFLWNTWFFDKAMAELLSKKIIFSSCWFCERSFNILLIQRAWHAAPVAMTYSASAEDRVTMGCFFESNATTPVPKWNVYLDVLYLSFVLPPLSLSIYPISLNFFEVEYIFPRSFVPLTYIIIILPPCQCESFGDSMNLDIRLTPYMMYGLVTWCMVLSLLNT